MLKCINYVLDISSHESNEEKILIDQLMRNITTEMQPILSPEQVELSEEADLNLPDLSELPLEDFANIEALLDGENTVDDMEAPMLDTSTDINIDEILDSMSGQSSPSIFDQNDLECNTLLDSMFDSDFMQGLSTDNSTCPVDMLAALSKECISETTEVIDSGKFTTDYYDNVVITQAGNKRAVSSIETSEPVAKRVRDDNDDEKTSFIRKENETEKDMIRRVKNNAASRVTRAKRKERHSELFQKQVEYEKSNAELRIKIELMQKEADMLRQVLVAKLSSK